MMFALSRGWECFLGLINLMGDWGRRLDQGLEVEGEDGY